MGRCLVSFSLGKLFFHRYPYFTDGVLMRRLAIIHFEFRTFRLFIPGRREPFTPDALRCSPSRISSLPANPSSFLLSKTEYHGKVQIALLLLHKKVKSAVSVSLRQCPASDIRKKSVRAYASGRINQLSCTALVLRCTPRQTGIPQRRTETSVLDHHRADLIVIIALAGLHQLDIRVVAHLKEL